MPGQGGDPFMARISTSMPRITKAARLRRIMLYAFLVLFLLPVVVSASLYAAGQHPASWRDANWSSIGMLPPASASAPARVLVMSGRAGGLKGVIAVHSWIV